MDMHIMAEYIARYGYAAIGAIILLQELGFPDPVPPGVLLVIAGVSASQGALNPALVATCACAADILGSSLLFFIFRSFGSRITTGIVRWLPLRPERIEALRERYRTRGKWGIFFGRLTPYVRGYASVAAGLIGMHPRTFISIAAASAVLWNCFFILAGWLAGRGVTAMIGGFSWLGLAGAFAGAALLYGAGRVYKNIKKSS